MPAPTGIFVGYTPAELAEERAIVKNRIRYGDRVAMSGGAKSSSKSFTLTAQQALIEIKYAENKLAGTLPPRRTYFDVRDRGGDTVSIT